MCSPNDSIEPLFETSQIVLYISTSMAFTSRLLLLATPTSSFLTTMGPNMEAINNCLCLLCFIWRAYCDWMLGLSGVRFGKSLKDVRMRAPPLAILCLFAMVEVGFLSITGTLWFVRVTVLRSIELSRMVESRDICYSATAVRSMLVARVLRLFW